MHIALVMLVTVRMGSAQPTATATQTEGPIALDGIADEQAWESASWHTDFTVANVDDDDTPLPRAEAQTRFAVVHDDEAAYVAVVCDEPNIADLKAETPWRDGSVWQDDCIEIFFDPGNDGRYYHQVMVNARGAIYDSYSADYGLVHSRLWNGAFEAAGHVDVAASRWSVEVRMPFGAVVLGEDAGSVWLWNVARERHTAGAFELNSWAPMRRNFHQPKLFGTLSGMPDDYSSFRLTAGEPEVDVSRAASGKATLGMSLTARNETGTERNLAATAALLEGGDDAVEAETVTVAAGEEATFEFPPLVFVGSAPNTNVVFSIRDGDSGRLLRAVVKQLSSEYRPIAVTMLQPCYRNCIYASQDLKELVFQVTLSAQVQRATERVAYRLTDEGGGEVLQGEAATGDLTEPLTAAVGELAHGTYTLTVAAVTEAGKTEAEAAVALRKLPPPPSGNEVRVDENRNVLVNGEPLLGIGWYGGVPTDDPRPDVVAMQNVKTPVVLNVPDPTPVQTAFDEHGIYSIVSVENGRLYYSFNLWQAGKEDLRPTRDEYQRLDEPSDDVKRMVREIVEAAQGEPGLLGYYIADEPEIHNVRSAYLEAFYQYLCQVDPYHPVFVTNDTIDGIVTHGYKCADVLDPDPYSPKWDYVPSFLKKVNEVGSLGKATWLTPWHSSGQAHFNREYGSAPPYPFRVLRNQTFAAIAYGATGFTGYTSAFFMPEIEHRYGLPHIWRELRYLEPAILAPNSEYAVQVEGAPELAAWAREVNGHRYLLLVHHKPGEADATVSWEPLKGLDKLHVMSEGREVDVRDGSFADHFAEGDVHIYTDDPEAAELPTVAAIEVELKQRHDDAAKPGNLLHWTTGTRVRCSEGYFAPWFHQYYYYAINGITDDKGWSAYSWKDNRAWLELTLKGPADVGRVVMHTPNIADYQLDFIAPGGVTRRVSVTGNEETVVTHNLNPPLPCLKLRLTVTGVRSVDIEHGKTPLLSEIEAYAEPGEGVVSPVEAVEAETAADVEVLFGEGTDPAALWEEDFTSFTPAPKYYWDARDTNWVLNPETFRAEAQPGGGIKVTSMSPQGYDAMTHMWPCDPAHRFFQVNLSDIQGEGYRFAHVGFGNSSGKEGYRGAVNTSRPGIYTVDTHYIHESFANGADTTCFVRVNTAGSTKNPDDTVTSGPEFTFDWLRLVGRPVDGLVVTQPDGGPLGDSVKPGDVLHFELHLAEAAQDAVVEVMTGPNYAPLPVNGEPYVQLRRGDDEGRVWVGEVTIGEGTGKFAPEGYPTVFRAAIVGGAVSETLASAFVAFE